MLGHFEASVPQPGSGGGINKSRSQLRIANGGCVEGICSEPDSAMRLAGVCI